MQSDNRGRMKQTFTVVNYSEKAGLSPDYLNFVYFS